MTRAEPSRAADCGRLSENAYASAFQDRVVPFWNAGSSAFIKTLDGTQLYTWHRSHPEAKAQIIISHGYSENSLKYRELAYNFFQQRYSVFFLDHRGHGWSDRVGPDRYSVDIVRFSDYSDDLQFFAGSIGLKATLPTFIFAHSMGAAIALDFIQKCRGRIQAAVLSSPMFQPKLLGIPVPWVLGAARALARLHAADQCTFGSGRMAAEFWTFERAGTRSLPRFELFKAAALAADLRLAGPTNRWVSTVLETVPRLLDPDRIQRLAVPLFVATAGRDRLVEPRPIQDFCRRVKGSEAHLYPHSFHEIWNERDRIRNPYLDDVLAFYQRMENT